MKRVEINRLDLDLRGIPPATAEAAIRLLGPALAQALKRDRDVAMPAHRIDAGRIEAGPGSGPQALAARIAASIVHSLGARRP
jgi:hypothetical protein